MTAQKLGIPYVEDMGEWSDRFRHHLKRIQNIDIKLILTDITKPMEPEWKNKKQEVSEDFIWAMRPGALDEIIKREYNADPGTLKAKNLLTEFKEYHFRSRRNTFRRRIDFFWTKQQETETL